MCKLAVVCSPVSDLPQLTRDVGVDAVHLIPPIIEVRLGTAHFVTFSKGQALRLQQWRECSTQVVSEQAKTIGVKQREQAWAVPHFWPELKVAVADAISRDVEIPTRQQWRSAPVVG